MKFKRVEYRRDDVLEDWDRGKGGDAEYEALASEAAAAVGDDDGNPDFGAWQTEDEDDHIGGVHLVRLGGFGGGEVLSLGVEPRMGGAGIDETDVLQRMVG